MDQNGLPDYVEENASMALAAASAFIDDVRALAYSLPEDQRNLVHPGAQCLIVAGPCIFADPFSFASHHAALRPDVL